MTTRNTTQGSDRHRSNRASWGRVGGLTTAGRNDVRETSRPGREAAMNRWRAEADPDGVLAPEERERRTRALLRAHLTRAAIRSAETRRRNRGAQSA